MKVGELVETTRARIGIPYGTLGLIVEREFRDILENGGCYIYTVHLVGKPSTFGVRWFLGRDLRVIK